MSSMFNNFLKSPHLQTREMEKRKEGKPGEARAALRRSVRENGCVFCYLATRFYRFLYLFLEDFMSFNVFFWHFWGLFA